MQIFALLQIVLIVVVGKSAVYGDEEVPNKSHQIHIDKLTEEYLVIEKELWKKISTQQILFDRGVFLNEIYREHNRTVFNDFGDSKSIWSLGIQKHQRLINTVLAVDTNAKNVKEYLAHAEYTKLMELAKNAVMQMEQSADELHSVISDKSFWGDILANVTILFWISWIYWLFVCFFVHFTSLFSLVFYRRLRSMQAASVINMAKRQMRAMETNSFSMFTKRLPPYR